MKPFCTLMTIFLAAASSIATASGDCCVPKKAGCNSPGTGIIRWYKAKDGTYREQLPYWTAMSRAEDADDLEIKLKAVEQTLTETQAAQEATVKSAADEKTALESQIAALTQELAAAKQTAVSEKERADKAEASLAETVKLAAELELAKKTGDEALTAVRGELKATQDDRDAMKTANADLQKQVAALNESRSALEAQLKSTQDQLEKMKQDAAPTTKPEVVEEKKAEGDPAAEPKSEGSESPEAPKEEPAAPAAN